MVRPDAQGSKPCITRRGLLRAWLGVAGLAACAGLGFGPGRPEQAYAANDGLDLDVDDLVSLFVGGNAFFQQFAEVEGVTLIDGNLGVVPANCSLAGRCIWGMAAEPTAEVTTLVIGGSYLPQEAAASGANFTGGNARIGGLVNGTAAQYRGNTRIGRGDEHGELWTPTTANVDQVFGDNPETSEAYVFPGCDSTTIVAGIGKQAALKAVTTGNASVDYNGYWANRVAPLVEVLREQPATGAASFAPEPRYTQDAYMPSQERFPGMAMQRVWSDMDVRITFTGDGYAKFQAFDVDFSDIEANLASLGKKNWSVAFEDVPSDATILVRVHGSNPVTRFGYKCYLNGQDCSTYVNAPTSDAGFTRYRDLASRVMWLFDDDCGTLTVDAAHAMHDGTAGTVEMYAPSRTPTAALEDQANPNQITRGNLLPGSIICPGDASVTGSTNGKLYIRGDLDFDTWEHHNVVWRGLRIPPTIDIPVEKVWEGAGYDKFWPGSVTVRLFGGSDEVGSITLSNDNEWKGTFRDLPLYDEGWQPISYVVREDEVAHFTAKVTGSETVGFTVTNTLVGPNYTNVGVRKVWTGEGAADALPDELVVHVVGTDGSDRPVTLTRAGHWQAIVDALPQLDSAGEWITYTLDERDVPDGFRLASVEGDVESGWVVTNEYQKGGGSLTKEARNKSWL